MSGGGSPGQRLSPGSGKGRAFPGKQWMSHCRPDEERGERVLRVAGIPCCETAGLCWEL